MTAPTQKHHDLDLWDHVFNMRYLGDPVTEFVAAAEADGWEVDLYDDSPIDPANPRSHIVTLQARYDYVPVRARDGRVVAIGFNAPFQR